MSLSARERPASRMVLSERAKDCCVSINRARWPGRAAFRFSGIWQSDRRPMELPAHYIQNGWAGGVNLRGLLGGFDPSTVIIPF